MKSFVAFSALVLAVCFVSSQGKSFGNNKNVNKNVNDNSNSDFDFLSSFLDSLLSQQLERKGKAAKAVPSVPIASKSSLAKSTATDDESAVVAVAISRSLPDTTTTITAQQQQEDQQQSFEVEILADDEFVDDISAFDDSQQEELSPFSAAAQLKFFQSLMEA